jgi:hypothetical protein
MKNHQQLGLPTIPAAGAAGGGLSAGRPGRRLRPAAGGGLSGACAQRPGPWDEVTGRVAAGLVVGWVVEVEWCCGGLVDRVEI